MTNTDFNWEPILATAVCDKLSAGLLKRLSRECDGVLPSPARASLAEYKRIEGCSRKKFPIRYIKLAEKKLGPQVIWSWPTLRPYLGGLGFLDGEVVDGSMRMKTVSANGRYRQVVVEDAGASLSTHAVERFFQHTRAYGVGCVGQVLGKPLLTALASSHLGRTPAFAVNTAGVIPLRVVSDPDLPGGQRLIGLTYLPAWDLSKPKQEFFGRHIPKDSSIVLLDAAGRVVAQPVDVLVRSGSNPKLPERSKLFEAMGLT